MHLQLLEENVDPILTEIVETDVCYHLLFGHTWIRDFAENRFILLDYLWEYLKSKIYATQPKNLANLLQRIFHGCRQITPDLLQNVRRCFEQNLFLYGR